MALVDIDEDAVGSAAKQLLSAGHKALALRCECLRKTPLVP